MKRGFAYSAAWLTGLTSVALGLILMSGCGGSGSIFDGLTTGTGGATTGGTNTGGTNTGGTNTGGTNTGGTNTGGATGGTTGGTNAGAACTTDTYQPNYAQNMADIDGKTFRLLFWPKFPIKIVFVKDANWTQEREDAVRAGFQRWVDKSTLFAQGAPAVEFVDGASTNQGEYGIKVAFVTQASLGGNTLGITTTFFFNTREIDHADMDIGITAPGGKVNTADDLKAIAGHEMGHALGISGHSPTDTDQMYFAYNGTNQTEVTQGDVNTLFTSYCGVFTRSRLSDRPHGPLNKITIACGE